MVRNTGRRLLMVAADAESIEVRSRSVCLDVSTSWGESVGLLREASSGSCGEELRIQVQRSQSKKGVQSLSCLTWKKSPPWSPQIEMTLVLHNTMP